MHKKCALLRFVLTMQFWQNDVCVVLTLQIPCPYMVLQSNHTQIQVKRLSNAQNVQSLHNLIVILAYCYCKCLNIIFLMRQAKKPMKFHAKTRIHMPNRRNDNGNNNSSNSYSSRSKKKTTNAWAREMRVFEMWSWNVYRITCETFQTKTLRLIYFEQKYSWLKCKAEQYVTNISTSNI